MTKRIFITFCAAAACCVLLGACESGSLAAAAGKRTRPADLGELQFITPAEGDPIATLSTTLGDISFVLYPDIAPMAVENFVGLAQQGYYNGLSFHRVIEGFLVQTGDATGTGAALPSALIPPRRAAARPHPAHPVPTAPPESPHTNLTRRAPHCGARLFTGSFPGHSRQSLLHYYFFCAKYGTL